MNPEPPTAQEKKRGAMVFAGLVAASLLVHSAWPDSGKVTAPVIAAGDTYSAALFRAMAEQGDAGAMFLLGKLYLGGQAFKVDSVEGHKWINLATSRSSTLNYRSYASERAVAAQSMTPQQIVEAQRRARAWLAAFEQRTK